MADLSTATPTVQNQPQFSLADTTTVSNNPEAINTQNSSNRLQFPSDLPPYYFQINLAKYQRSGWDTAGNLTTERTVVLPMPTLITDTVSVLYETKPLNIIPANALNAINGQQNGGVGGTAAGQAAQIGVGAANALPGAGNAILASAGAAINEFLVVMLKGPSYRDLEFIWRFSPHNLAESTTLAEIIATINDATVPSLPGSLGSAFWGFPYLFSCSFQFSGGGGGALDLGAWLYRFKPAFCTSRTWNYTPSNQAAFYASSKAPESVELRIAIREVEYWLQGQYNSGLSPSGFNLSTFNNLKNQIQDFAKSIGQKPLPNSTPIPKTQNSGSGF